MCAAAYGGTMNIIPNRMTLNYTKQRLAAARKGHSLLKRKSGVLKRKSADISKNIKDQKIMLGELLGNASFSYSEILYSVDNISAHVLGSVNTARIRVRTKMKNVSGVQIPEFSLEVGDKDDFELVGIGRGGQHIQDCKSLYIRAAEVLVELASAQVSFTILDQAIRTTDKRYNAIEFIIIPRIEEIIRFIESEIDENEREEFFRLKKIQSKKREQIQAEQEKAVAAGGQPVTQEYEISSVHSRYLKGEHEYF